MWPDRIRFKSFRRGASETGSKTGPRASLYPQDPCTTGRWIESQTPWAPWFLNKLMLCRWRIRITRGSCSLWKETRVQRHSCSHYVKWSSQRPLSWPHLWLDGLPHCPQLLLTYWLFQPHSPDSPTASACDAWSKAWFLVISHDSSGSLHMLYPLLEILNLFRHSPTRTASEVPMAFC